MCVALEADLTESVILRCAKGADVLACMCTSFQGLQDKDLVYQCCCIHFDAGVTSVNTDAAIVSEMYEEYSYRITRNIHTQGPLGEKVWIAVKTVKVAVSMG